MADLLDSLFGSDNGVSDVERGRAHVRLAQASAASAVARRSATLFNTRPPAKADFETYRMAEDLAFGAGILGMAHAARHLRHYLAGGELGDLGRQPDHTLAPEPVPLTLDVVVMLREIPAFREVARDEARALDARIREAWRAGKHPSRLAGRRRVAGTTAVTDRDWFYAVGRFTFRVTATVTYPRSPPTPKDARVAYSLAVEDFYDWDQDAVTLPFPHPDTGEAIVIPDGVMRRLHVVGLAREYPMAGSLDNAPLGPPVTGNGGAP